MDTEKLKKVMKWLGSKASVLALILLALAAGYLFHAVVRGGPGSVETGTSAGAAGEEQAEKKIKYWTCSMHPQIKQPSPGDCPICGMDLIPVTEGEGAGAAEGAGPTLTMSEHAKTLAEIQTSPVERRYAEADIRLVGKVTYDETRVKDISAWVPGRLDRLFVDYTGVPVKKGDHLVSIYSPKLISAQEELLQTLKTEARLKDSSSSVLKQTTSGTVRAAREKLELLGLTPAQVQKIEETGEPIDHLIIYAPAGGIVVEKHKKKGAYVKTGSTIYTIADLSHVWVQLDAYESDMMWLHYGQPVTVRAEAYPGKSFEGRIAFIDPVLNERTRTVKIRIDVDNPEGKLKPGMFVRATVRPKLAAAGRVMEPGLVGKWICRMHPGEISDEPGECSVCEMPLVSTESLGYVSVEKKAKPPLVIPASAPLITGERAVVYVADPDADQPTYEGREIVLGPRAGDHYLVESGLREGEQVVTRGNFKIDSALQIQAKASMMSPDDEKAEEKGGPEQAAAQPEEPAPVEVPAEFVARLKSVLGRYLEMHEALSSDDASAASAAASRFLDALADVNMDLLETPEAHKAWMPLASALQKAARNAQQAGKDITAQREAFSALSGDMLELIKRFGPLAEDPLYVLRCPMAFGGRGARWLQNRKQTRNPFYGSAMLKCGDVVETLASQHEHTESPEDDAENE